MLLFCHIIIIFDVIFWHYVLTLFFDAIFWCYFLMSLFRLLIFSSYFLTLTFVVILSHYYYFWCYFLTSLFDIIFELFFDGIFQCYFLMLFFDVIFWCYFLAFLAQKLPVWILCLNQAVWWLHLKAVDVNQLMNLIGYFFWLW